MKLRRLGTIGVLATTPVVAISCSKSSDSIFSSSGARKMYEILGAQNFTSTVDYVTLVSEVKRDKTIDELFDVVGFTNTEIDNFDSVALYLNDLASKDNKIKSYQMNLSGNPRFDGTIKSVTMNFEFKAIDNNDNVSKSNIEFKVFASDAKPELINLYEEVSGKNFNSSYSYEYIEGTLMNEIKTGERFTISTLNSRLNLSPGISSHLPSSGLEGAEDESGYIINSLRFQRITGVKKAYTVSFNVNTVSGTGTLKYVMRIQFALLSSNFAEAPNV